MQVQPCCAVTAALQDSGLTQSSVLIMLALSDPRLNKLLHKDLHRQRRGYLAQAQGLNRCAFSGMPAVTASWVAWQGLLYTPANGAGAGAVQVTSLAHSWSWRSREFPPAVCR